MPLEGEHHGDRFPLTGPQGKGFDLIKDLSKKNRKLSEERPEGGSEERPSKKARRESESESESELEDGEITKGDTEAIDKSRKLKEKWIYEHQQLITRM